MKSLTTDTELKRKVENERSKRLNEKRQNLDLDSKNGKRNSKHYKNFE